MNRTLCTHTQRSNVYTADEKFGSYQKYTDDSTKESIKMVCLIKDMNACRCLKIGNRKKRTLFKPKIPRIDQPVISSGYYQTSIWWLYWTDIRMVFPRTNKTTAKYFIHISHREMIFIAVMLWRLFSQLDVKLSNVELHPSIFRWEMFVLKPLTRYPKFI